MRSRAARAGGASRAAQQRPRPRATRRPGGGWGGRGGAEGAPPGAPGGGRAGTRGARRAGAATAPRGRGARGAAHFAAAGPDGRSLDAAAPAEPGRTRGGPGRGHAPVAPALQRPQDGRGKRGSPPARGAPSERGAGVVGDAVRPDSVGNWGHARGPFPGPPARRYGPGRWDQSPPDVPEPQTRARTRQVPDAPGTAWTRPRRGVPRASGRPPAGTRGSGGHGERASPAPLPAPRRLRCKFEVVRRGLNSCYHNWPSFSPGFVSGELSAR